MLAKHNHLSVVPDREINGASRNRLVSVEPIEVVSYDEQLNSERASVLGEALLRAEGILIDLGITDYKQDPSKLESVKARRALNTYQLIRHSFTASSSKVLLEDGQKIIDGMPQTD